MKNHPNTVRLIELMNEYQVDGPTVASLMGRALKTVHCWRSGSSLISRDMLDLLEMRLIRLKKPEVIHQPNTFFGYLAERLCRLDSANLEKFCVNAVASQPVERLSDMQREMLAAAALVALDQHGVKTTHALLCQLMGLKDGATSAVRLMSFNERLEELQTRKNSGSPL